MSSERQAATVRGLVEEAKKRIVFLVICVVGLSYLMSLTSSSVLVNLPAATFLIIILRYLSLDFDMRRKAAACNSKTPLTNISYQNKPFEGPKVIVQKPDWRRKVNSPAVEDAIDQFSRHLVSEWVTNLWYSRITPDRQGPEELVQIMNGVLGEVSFRMRNINLIDLLTRDIINLICTHLELFRSSNAKIEKQESGLLTFEHRDMQLKSILAAENKLHPALFSAESEHRVLQHLMEGLIAFTFRPDDLQCALFHYIVRELLSCAVMRPVLNLANPRFINEKIESLVISLNKANKGATSAQVALQSKQNGSSKISSGHFSPFLDPSVKGVELVQLKRDQPKNAAGKPVTNNVNGTPLAKDPLLSVDTQSSHSWSSLPPDTKTGDEKDTQYHPSGGEWGDMLDMISRRKTKALAPEHLENIWTKGRDYKKKEGTKQFIDSVSQNSSARISKVVDHSNVPCKQKDKEGAGKVNPDTSAILSECNYKSTTDNLSPHTWNISSESPVASCIKDDDCKLMPKEEVESGSSSSYITEDEETACITGLNSPGTKIWDGKNNRNTSVPRIHHPLESFEGYKTRKAAKRHEHSQRSPRAKFEQKRSRLSSQKKHIWQEVERTSFLSGDGLDILNSSNGKVKSGDSSDDSEAEMLGRVLSGATASSSAPSIPVPENARLDFKASRSSLLADSFLKLRCEVLGANVVKSGSRTFAVYSISVTDVNNNSWSVKRRFRHFEELHRRLKEFPEYNLHLPPKHFLSTGLDVPVIQERCKLLDIYLKKLLQLPTISGTIEVWDFLSVDSQTYIFSNSITIIETLSVDLDDTAHEKRREVHNHVGNVTEPSSSIREHSNAESKESVLQMEHDVVPDGSRLNTEVLVLFPPKKSKNEFGKPFEDSGSDSENVVQKNISKTRNLVKTVKGSEGDGLQESSESFVDAAADPTLPPEWVPPNLSVPILDLIDVIFQLQEGGWIRRKAFWMVKQVLQLGMGDALDDWLIEKIQLLRRGSVVASGIKRLEQILWPDGIFITKHPKRQRHAPSGNPSQGSPKKEDIQKLDEQQHEQAERRAKFVYELMIDDAPAAIVGLVGRKEYEQCAKDLYYFLQSSVCLKQLAFELLELLLMSAFPELDYVFRQLHEEKPKFGDFKPN